jgi:predicted acetyltransferase
MDDDTIGLRQPDAASLYDWARPTAAAFGGDFSRQELDHGFLTIEQDRLIGAVDGDAWVGTGGSYSFRLTVPGGEVGAAGITAIAVAPSHRRRGILRRMMGWLLDQAIERDEAVAILWASESAIYQRFGYGMATLQSVFDIDRTRVRFVRPVEPVGRMRLVDRDEACRLIPPVYDAVRAGIPGAVSRTEGRWRNELFHDAEWMQRGNGSKYIAVLEVDGTVRAYAIYRVKSEWDDRGPNNTVLALEVTGLDAATERTIWHWLFETDLAGHIKGWRGPVPHPLLLQLTEPRRLGLGVREGLWLRLLDMPAALEARTYQGLGAISFELTDDFRPVNAGRWRLEVGSDGSAAGDRGVARASVTAFDGSPDLTLDTSDLASVYLGAFTFADLARADRIGECRPGAVAEADRLFATTATAWCSTMF